MRRIVTILTLIAATAATCLAADAVSITATGGRAPAAKTGLKGTFRSEGKRGIELCIPFKNSRR